MSNLIRFTVSLEKDLLEKFDKQIKRANCPTRSKAITDLIRTNLIKEDWTKDKTVAGAITLVYDHHRRELVNTLTDIQHNFHGLVISSQHVHLDHDNCLEVIVLKGKAVKVLELANKLKSVKGVKHASLTTTTTGKGL